MAEQDKPSDEQEQDQPATGAGDAGGGEKAPEQPEPKEGGE